MIISNRMVLAVAIAAVSLVATSVPTDARQPERHDQKHKEGQKQHKAQKQQQQRHHKEQKAEQHQQRHQRQEVRLSEKQQRHLIDKQRQRLAQYRRHLERQQRVVHQRSARLQQGKRVAQYRFQQQYLERLRQQQIRIANERNHDYRNDPYFYTPPSYRYRRAGSYYETNEYGANLLRSAVNNGYEEGFRAGEADREDRWPSNYRDSSVYDDANFGYGGYYVDRADYNHYFREGFRRGYEDGHGSRHQYGSLADGKNSILGDVLASILNFQSLRQ